MKQLQKSNNIIQAISCRKIRDYSENEKKSESKVLINYLLALLGISMAENDGKVMHYIILEEFMNDTLQNYTYEEIKLAFKNWVKGDYPEIPIYNKLDSLLVGKVMKAFDNQKTYAIQQEKIKIQKQKLMEEEKIEIPQEAKYKIIVSGLENAFNDFKAEGKFSYARLYLYDFLYVRDLLPKDVATKKAVHKMACERILSKPNLTREEKVMNSLTNADNKPSDIVLQECKRITLERFFDKHTTFKQINDKL